MRLLICTQVVSLDDKKLSFFHGWIEALAPHYESIDVICLYEGRHSLPSTVTVHSLGKEKGAGTSLQYALRLLKLLLSRKLYYDAVFVHMNQEYLLTAGWYWKMVGRPVYLWRNHYKGSLLTDIAGSLSRKVFYTSQFSYTAKSKNAVLMPVGVDTHLFTGREVAEDSKRDVLFFTRLSPSKKPEMFIDALEILRKRNTSFTASVYGTCDDDSYLASLKQRAKSAGLEDVLVWHDGVPHKEAPEVFASHTVYVNLGVSGMYDKMLFEASASGCLVTALSEDFRLSVGDDRVHFHDVQTLADSITGLLSLSGNDAEELRAKLQNSARQNSLTALTDALVRECTYA